MIEIQCYASSSKANCYRITDGTTPLLIEAGVSYKKLLHEHNFSSRDIAGCLITHEHQDHCKAAQEIMLAGIDVYASWGTFNAAHLGGHRSRVIEAGKQIKIGPWTILPFETEHDAAEPLGFLLANQVGDKLLFATDTYYIRYKFQGLTHIMVECNHASDILQANVEAGSISADRKNRLMKSHFNLDNVKDFLRANDLQKVREIHLLHLSDGNSDEARFKREIQELTGKLVYIADK